MRQTIMHSRRDFFKAAALAGAGLVLPRPAGAAGKIGAAGEVAALFDLSRCQGCGACVEACGEANASFYPEPRKPFPSMFPAKVKVEDFSDKRQVSDRLTPYNWLFIQTARGEIQGKPFEINIPRRCMHCQNPPCALMCPWGAASKERTGAVVIDADICLGGAKCRQVCPWAIPQRQTGVGLYLKLMPHLGGNGVMYKCRRCVERLAEGRVPACVEACPYEVQSFGPREEIVAKAHALAKEMGGYIYGEKENGGTNTLYVSPVPFSALNAAVDKGPGKPHLKPVAYAMGDSDKLAMVALTAPAAGLAGGFLRLARNLPGSRRADPPASLAEAAVGSRAAERSWLKWGYLGLMIGLALTGTAQMPIYNRYYVSDLPGLGWLNDMYLTHVLHYLLAAVFMLVMGFVAARHLRSGRNRRALTLSGGIRAALLVGLVLTGLLRVAKNMPGLFFDPGTIIAVDLGHLGLAALLGVAALWARLSGRRAWLRPV